MEKVPLFMFLLLFSSLAQWLVTAKEQLNSRGLHVICVRLMSCKATGPHLLCQDATAESGMHY